MGRSPPLRGGGAGLVPYPGPHLDETAAVAAGVTVEEVRAADADREAPGVFGVCREGGWIAAEVVRDDPFDLPRLEAD